eukprot:CAMPEP_0116880194 /NCGR_PEP_ID=MMETSP0463-20121206/12101_1 /TAXON_ID=181622 /ORGANISM="Strombidinopsis sp, Strain SopsisLIS2011" /LENGTH=118 /DNA_ID=CAMNT_0004530485 /DNA_START=325 /DNA_END=681 /DNA_ORIENTATION=-
MLCVEYPTEILHGILYMLDKREEENVEFDEFLCGIKTILLFDNYFDEMESLFRHLDYKKQGKIIKDDLVKSASKLREVDTELRVPTEDDIESVYSSMIVEEEGFLNYDEYLIVLFKSV